MLYPIRIYQTLNLLKEMDHNKWTYNLKKQQTLQFFECFNWVFKKRYILV